LRKLGGNRKKIGAQRSALPDDKTGDAMSKLAALGFWTCATVYAAVGIVGVFLLGSQPNIANATDGYGTVRLAGHK
jgi:hypothetical protein